MSLKKIISISGMPGLFKVVAKNKNGFIVESIADQKRFPVSSTQRITMLEDISMYCTSRDAALKEVMQKMKENDEAASAISAKAEGEELKNFFETILPDYDKDRVYASDIQKVIKWYQLLKDHVSFEDDPEEAENEADENGESDAGEIEKKNIAHSKAEIGLHKPSTERKVTSAKTRKKV